MGGIVSLIPGFAGFAIPALILGGISFAVVNEDFHNAVQGLLPGSQTDDAVDESIAESGGGATAQALPQQEQAEKREASRNPFQNFFYGKIMGEDAEYDRQMREQAQGTETSGTSGTPPVRSTTPMLLVFVQKELSTEGDPVVEEMIEILIETNDCGLGGEKVNLEWLLEKVCSE